MMISMHSTTISLRLACAACVILLASLCAVLADSPMGIVPQGPIGEWLVAKKVARIRIVNCDQKLWGVVSWEMQPGIDNKNPNPDLRTRPTLGMPVLIGMAQSKANQWDGLIYNSEDGHTYSANIKLENPDTLRVQGCFFGVLCGGEDWSRVYAADIPNTVPANRPPLKKTGANQPPTDDAVCLSILGPAWLSHQRGLK
jgi:uncharacterized protein (DUF2147 family)